MAFVSDASPDQQNQNQVPGQNPLSQQAPITSAPNASSAKGATGQPSNTGPSQPFTNLSSYLTADAPQIQAEGQQIAGGLTQQYGQVTGAVDQAGANFNSKVNAGYTPLDQGVLDAFGKSPTAVAADPTQAKTFSGMYGDTYTGPANFESTPDYLDLSGKVQAATTNAAGMQTPEGIQGYFSSSSPTYTKGMGTLDAALLQGNPDVVSTIQSAAKPFEGLPGYLTSAVSSGNAAAQAANQQAQAAKAAAQAAFGTQVGNLNTNVNSETSAAVKAVQDYNAAVQKYQADIANGIPQANQIKSIGDQYGVSWTGGAPPMIDPNSIKSPDVITNLPSAANASSADDYAMLSALEKLSGGSVTAPISDDTAAQGGTFKAPGSVDTSALLNALTGTKDWAVNKGNNATVGGNPKDFVTAGNDWYVNLLRDLGWHYPGTGPYPAVFNTYNNTPIGGGGGGGLGGPGTPGGV